jgi:twitching motility two-component system response regulator PilG
MQGTLSEIDIRSILQLIELGQRTGELLVEAYPSRLGGKGKERLSQGRQETQSSARLSPFHRAVWFIFFVNGQIIYATDNSNNSLFRLRDYLYLYQAQDALNQLHLPAITTTNAPEYASVWMLLEHHILTPAQGRRIIQSMIRETLFDLLSLHQGSFIFKIAPALAPQLKTWEVAPLMKTIIKQVQHWKAFYPQIQSPHQALLVNDDAKLQAALPSDVYQNLSGWIDGKTSLRQIARYLIEILLPLLSSCIPI